MTKKSKISIKGEPKIVSEIRDHILSSFTGLEFQEEGHKYFLNGVSMPSVSKIIEGFVPPTDWDSVAENYAVKNGETAQYWLDKWKFNNLKATTSGTLTHEFGESLGWLRNGHPELITESCKPKFIKENNWLIPTRPKEEAVLRFWDEIDPRLHLVLEEAKIFNTNVTQPYCGTFDLLMYFMDELDHSKDGLVVLDYKTNGSLTSNFSRERGKMMLPPFADYFDEAKSHYVIQQSAYVCALREIGLDVRGIRLIWLKDEGTYELIPLPDISKEQWFKDAI